MPDAAIIVPHYNDVARLLRCLKALMPQLSNRTELVVVDNNSTDALDEIRTTFPDLRIVTEPSSGAAPARNRGVAETTSPRLFFIDADCVPAENWVDTALSTTDQRKDADVIGGAVTVFDETPAPRSGAEAFETVFAFDNRTYVKTKGFSVTANLLTYRDVFEATGPFDGSKSEDVDWCQRATALGYTLSYQEGLRVSHPSRSDWSALRKKWSRMSHEGFELNGNDPRARIHWGLRGLMMIISIAPHTIKILRHPELNSVKERLSGVFTLVRIRLLRMVWMIGQAAKGSSSGR